MTTLSARLVRQPRQLHYCDMCSRPLLGPHIRLYGMADRELPWTLRLHPTDRCCPNLSNDPKIAAALAEAAPLVSSQVERPSTTPEEAGEQARKAMAAAAHLDQLFGKE